MTRNRATLCWLGMMAVAAPCVAQPVNDDCGSPTPIAVGVPTPWTNFGASTDGAFSSCAFDSEGGDVWFSVSSATGGSFRLVGTIDQADSAVPASVLSGCGGTEEGCSADITGGFGSPIVFSIPAGQTRLLRISTYLVDIGPGSGMITVETVAGPSNDRCANAEVISGPGVYGFDNTTADTDGPGSTCSATQPGSQDVWFAYTPSVNRNICVRNSFAGSTLVFSLFDACGGSQVACDQAGTQNDLLCATVQAGTTYYLRVASNTGVPGGPGSIEFAEFSTPANDVCGSAQVVSAGMSYPWNTNGAEDGFHPTVNCSTLPGQTDVWFVYVPAADGTAVFETSGNAGVATLLTAYDNCMGATLLGCNNNRYWNQNNGPSQIAVKASAGVPMYVRLARRLGNLSGFPSASGVLTVSQVAAVPGDDCESAVNVGPGIHSADTTFATESNASDPLCLSLGVYRDRWFSFTPTFSGTAVIYTCGELVINDTYNSNSVLAVYVGSCGGDPIACNDDFDDPVCSERRSRVTLPVSVGTNYLIRVGGQDGTASGFGRADLIIATCPADFNISGTVSVQDIFDFLREYFSGAPGADFNASGTVTVQDIFDFLTAYFTPCP